MNTVGLCSLYCEHFGAPLRSCHVGGERLPSAQKVQLVCRSRICERSQAFLLVHTARGGRYEIASQHCLSYIKYYFCCANCWLRKNSIIWLKQLDHWESLTSSVLWLFSSLLLNWYRHNMCTNDDDRLKTVRSLVVDSLYGTPQTYCVPIPWDIVYDVDFAINQNAYRYTRHCIRCIFQWSIIAFYALVHGGKSILSYYAHG